MNSFEKRFDKCPGCGSEERYFESILWELQNKDLVDKKATCFDFQLQEGLAVPPQKIALMPFGSELPGFKRIWDTCCNCGMVYSVFLGVVKVKKSLELPSHEPPNRAERRRMGMPMGMPEDLFHN